MAEHLWCLYNRRTQVTVEGMVRDEVRAFMMAIPKEEWSHWYLWGPGLAEWRPISEIQESLKPIHRPIQGHRPPVPAPAPVPPSGKLSSEENSEELKDLVFSHKLDEEEKPAKILPLRDLPDVEVEKDGEFIPRSFKRYSRKLRVELECQGQKFVTYSVDISIGGVRVADPIPDWVVGYCKLDLINENSDEVAELTCSVVEGQPPTQRYRLEFNGIQTMEQRVQLEQWILSAA